MYNTTGWPTLTRSSIHNWLLVVEWQALVTTFPGGEPSTHTLVGAASSLQVTADRMTSARALSHHIDCAYCVVLLHSTQYHHSEYLFDNLLINLLVLKPIGNPPLPIHPLPYPIILFPSSIFLSHVLLTTSLSHPTHLQLLQPVALLTH
jgi:hypothetical protein